MSALRVMQVGRDGRSGEDPSEDYPRSGSQGWPGLGELSPCSPTPLPPSPGPHLVTPGLDLLFSEPRLSLTWCIY